MTDSSFILIIFISSRRYNRLSFSFLQPSLMPTFNPSYLPPTSRPPKTPTPSLLIAVCINLESPSSTYSFYNMQRSCHLFSLSNLSSQDDDEEWSAVFNCIVFASSSSSPNPRCLPHFVRLMSPPLPYRLSLGNSRVNSLTYNGSSSTRIILDGLSYSCSRGLRVSSAITKSAGGGYCLPLVL